MANIDDELINALFPDEIKKIVHNSNINCDTEVDIGENRTADILVTIQGKQQVVIEVGNDRNFDVGEILRKLKRERKYPTIVIIPKEYERFAWRFQQSKFFVWFWTATCQWVCRKCDKITKSTTSLTPTKPNCKDGQNNLQWIEPEKIEFEEAKNNPTETFEKLSHIDAFVLL